MNLTDNEKKFLDNLDKNVYYEVENRSYSHAKPSEMTAPDVRALIEKANAGVDITEGSINISGTLLL